MAQQTFTLTINDPPPSSLSITSAPPPDGVRGEPYSHQFTAIGGSGVYMWQRVAGVIPPGLTLNSLTGLLSGIPAQSGSFQNITIEVVDA